MVAPTGTAPPRARTLGALLAELAAREPAAECVVTAAGRASRRDLLADAARVAAALRRDGVGSGDRVALLLDNRAEWLAVALGATAVGAVAAPINTWVKARDLEYLLGHARPSVLVMLDALGKQDYLAHLREIMAGGGPPELRRLVVVGGHVPPGATAYADWVRSEAAELPDDARPDDVALVLYTSGSTARPKAVPLTHRHLIENGWAIGDRQGLTGEDRVFVSVPLAWAYGAANALMATLTHGATLVLQSVFDAARAYPVLQRERCTAIYTLPVMTRALLDLPGFDATTLPQLRRGLTLGPPAELALVHDRLGVDAICNIYGSTEVYGNCCVTPHDAPFARRAASQGPPLDGVEIRIADPRTREPLASGQIGEILVRGRVTPGYLDDDRIACPVVDDDGFFATGDLGSVDAQGWLTFVARDSEMIKTAGINVSPAEVEEFLATHPDVVEVAVVGAEAGERGQAVVAFVRLAPSATTTPEEIQAWCRSQIASYKAPVAVIPVTTMPTTATGKLARRDLVRRATETLRGLP